MLPLLSLVDMYGALPGVSGNRGTKVFIQGEKGNKDLQTRKTWEQRKSAKSDQSASVGRKWLTIKRTAKTAGMDASSDCCSGGRRFDSRVRPHSIRNDLVMK